MPEGNVSTTFTGDSRDFERKVDQMQRKIDTLTARLKKTGDESKRTKQAQEDAFGGRALSNLQAYVTGLLSLHAASSAIRNTLGEIDRDQQQAAAQQRSRFASLGKLQQVSTGAADFQWMLARTADTFAVTGNWAKAANLTFMLRSGGMLGNAQAGETGTRALFAQLMGSGFIESPDAMAEAAAKWMSAMGTAETGTIQQILSKGVAASGIAVGTIEQLMSSSARAGAMAAQVGISDEELITAAAVASKTLGADEAGIYVRSLLSDLSKAGYTGKPLMQLLDQVQAEGKTSIFGDVRSKTAYGLLTGAESRSLYAQTLGDVQAANRRDLTSERSRLVELDPALRGARALTEEESRLELAKERRATRRNLEERYQALLQRKAIESGKSDIATRIFENIGQFLTTQDFYLRGAEVTLTQISQREPGFAADNGVTSLLRDIRDELKKGNGGRNDTSAATSPSESPTGNEALRGAM